VTKTAPATFLLGVEPLQPSDLLGEKRLSWTVCPVRECLQEATRPLLDKMEADVDRLFGQAPHGCGQCVVGHGQRYTVLRGLLQWGSGEKAWHLRIDVDRPYDVRIFAIDAQTPHLLDIHSQVQCSFNQAWQNFNERQSGKHHDILWMTRRWIMCCLGIAVLLMLIVLSRFMHFVSSDKLLRRVVAAKLLCQDLPQQVGIVAFFYSWYSKDGLRCQMCLFNSHHCGDWDPLSLDNILLFGTLVLSAASCQLLIRGRHGLDVLDTWCLQIFRLGLFGLSVLPLSAAFYLSVLWFHYPGKWSVVAVCLAGCIPMVMGIFALCCAPALCLMRTPCGEAWLAERVRRIEAALGL